ncbi:hypothetical protein [uncultured Ferrimonas sp.]|uniref:hypothetical protein n=1 Tax=uncultured Ferrimonas sp. TaxID=432640 RepID=UPI0026263368|nr:hypothetical protein [uncultured Ferrimonas sp.]
MAPVFQREQLLDCLFSLPTQGLGALQLSQVIVSVLAHHQQPAQLHFGHHAGAPHHWVLWLPPAQSAVIVDFRWAPLTSLDDAFCPANLPQYRSDGCVEFSPVPMVMLPSFCQQQHAHFDHLLGQ